MVGGEKKRFALCWFFHLVSLSFHNHKAQQSVEGDVEERKLSLNVARVTHDSNRNTFEALPDAGGKEVGHAALQCSAFDCRDVAGFNSIHQEFPVGVARTDLICAAITIRIDRLGGGINLCQYDCKESLQEKCSVVIVLKARFVVRRIR